MMSGDPASDVKEMQQAVINERCATMDVLPQRYRCRTVPVKITRVEQLITCGVDTTCLMSFAPKYDSNKTNGAVYL